MPIETELNLKKSSLSSNTVSCAIECNEDSHLLEAGEKEDESISVESRTVVPSAAAGHSLFGENRLLLDQD